MKTKVVVEVNGVEYTIVSYENEDYVRAVASDVSRRISDIQMKSMRTTKADAAVLTCLDLSDENRKLQQNNDNMRQQILEYIDEIAILNKKIANLERRVKKLPFETDDEQVEQP